jgi:hypothetical protein
MVVRFGVTRGAVVANPDSGIKPLPVVASYLANVSSKPRGGHVDG